MSNRIPVFDSLGIRVGDFIPADSGCGYFFNVSHWIAIYHPARHSGHPGYPGRNSNHSGAYTFCHHSKYFGYVAEWPLSTCKFAAYSFLHSDKLFPLFRACLGHA